ncbi:MAG: creatininase family protein [Phycisphaeraceae bacterium]|nr:creatininase family protein [Phycisphaeraceae bacterium]
MREVQWERMFPDELEAAMAACPVVWVPQGLCEPHGPQNALGLDALKAQAICVAAARAHGGIVAPVDFWHVHETGVFAPWARNAIGQMRTWLTAVPAWIHFKHVCYQWRAFDALGFHAAIMLTGHYGANWTDLKTLTGLLQPHLSMRLYGLPDWEANINGFDGQGNNKGDHAGKVETSLLWALRPECVDVSRIPPPEVQKSLREEHRHFAMGADAPQADRRVGERMVRDEVAYLGRRAKELLAAYDKDAPKEHKPVSFVELERIWQEVVKPNFVNFRCMQNVEPPNLPPADSRWSFNCHIPDGIG